MGFIGDIYNFVLLYPITNTLVWIAEFVPAKDFGIAVILLTLIVRGASYPLGVQAILAQKKFAELQPKMKEIKEKFKGKQEEQTRAMLQLYKDAKVNPLASFLPLLIQLPIFFVFYQIFSKGIHPEQLSALYSFVPMPEEINTSFLGILDLNKSSFPIAVVAGILQFVQLKQATASSKKEKKGSKPDIASMMQKQMPFIFPIIIVWIAARLPSAFALYLITTTVFSIWQHWFITRKEKKEEVYE
jgi:YidC/Oxa1 family membrane protein insertase